jgi:outer membrane murein-binding lipoprotein Lpp
MTGWRSSVTVPLFVLPGVRRPLLAAAIREGTGTMTDDHQTRAALRRVGGGIRFSLRSHPLTSAMASLVVAVTAAAVILGTIRIEGAQSTAVSDQHAQQLSSLASAVTALAASLEDEQTDLAVYIAVGRPAQGDARLLYQAQMSVSGVAANRVVSLAGRSDLGLAPQVQTALSSVLNRVADLAALRSEAIQTQTPVLGVIADYSQVTSTLAALDAQIGSNSGDLVFARDISTLGWLQYAEDAAAQQRSILAAALTSGQFQPGEQAALSTAFQQEQSEMTVFDAEATPAQQNAYHNVVAGQEVDAANQMLQQALTGPNGSLRVTLPPGTVWSSAQEAWRADMGFKLNQMRTAEQNLLGTISARAQTLHGQATQTIRETWLEMAVAVIAVVAFAAGLTRVTRRRSRFAAR